MPNDPRRTPRQKTSPAVWFVVGVAALLAVVSVAGGYFIGRHDERAIGTGTTTGAVSHLELGAPPETYGGINAAEHARLAAARCAREERCGAVGPGRRYATRAACEGERLAQTSAFLPEARCRDGIVPGKAAACAAAIDRVACSTSLEMLDALEECRTETLCAPY